MAESVIGITEGSGKFGHTYQRVIGANTVEDGVVLLGENYLASYTAQSGDVSTATLNSHLYAVMAGASLKVRVRRIEVYLSAPATTAALMSLALYRLSTAGTGGTAVTPNPLDTTDAASGATSMTLPTVKGTEGVLMWASMPYMMQTIGASAQLNQPIAVIDFDRLRSKPLIIAAGAANGFALKNLTAIAGATVRTTVWLDETNFA